MKPLQHTVVITPMSIRIFIALDPLFHKGIIILVEQGNELERSYRRIFDEFWENAENIDIEVKDKPL
jgi:hypothetical protein